VPRTYSINQRTLLTTTIALFCFLGIVGWVLDRAFNDSAAQAVQLRLETTLYGLLAVADVTSSQQLSIPPQRQSRMCWPIPEERALNCALQVSKASPNQ